ncbi:hypothetical protein HA402_001418 [Bradysia odoriphaga]|nr:hypothetical protein HA402_001418 [Bradysia odoriphaga]
MTGTRAGRSKSEKASAVKRSSRVAKPKASSFTERKSRRLMAKVKRKIVGTDLYIVAELFGYQICQRDMIHGETLSLAAICDTVTSYFNAGGDVLLVLDDSGTVQYELINMDFYNNSGRIPSKGTLLPGKSIFRPQDRPVCKITVFNGDSLSSR